ncbi:hypothetical protein E2562_026732 [Oryza meyeriana var. granulata]|uniref:Uncharacterized protein n=1 Tax=Oryza meyeriana var. granulata TaxID=110450 RepID=A0A6G1EZ52_9ORYZ|nr:hypothetical protein E2562_026732 [Oryza meyeriana var. granulata]
MASTGAGGFVRSMQFLATTEGSSLSCTGRSFAIKFSLLPSPRAFGSDTPLVVTWDKNYTVHDMPEFLTTVSLPAYEVKLYKTRALPVAMNFKAPMVLATCINGASVPMTDKLVY